MTYNIRLGIQKGLPPIADVILEAQADIVALQEVGRHWTMGPKGDSTAALAELTDLRYSVFAPAISRLGPAHYGHALLSRWPLTHPTIVELPRVVDEPRVLLKTTIVTPAGALNVIATHLSHIEDRPAQGRVLEEHALSSARPTLVLGDLNEYRLDGWLESLSTSFNGVGATGPTFPAHAPTRCIDYVLSSGLKRYRTEVLFDEDASDHRPVVAQLGF